MLYTDIHIHIHTMLYTYIYHVPDALPCKLLDLLTIKYITVVERLAISG